MKRFYITVKITDQQTGWTTSMTRGVNATSLEIAKVRILGYAAWLYMEHGDYECQITSTDVANLDCSECGMPLDSKDYSTECRACWSLDHI